MWPGWSNLWGSGWLRSLRGDLASLINFETDLIPRLYVVNKGVDMWQAQWLTQSVMQWSKMVGSIGVPTFFSKLCIPIKFTTCHMYKQDSID